MTDPRALVLEDDEATRELLLELVRAEGFDTVGAGSLAEARGLMADRAVDLLMLDVRLPDGGGTELLDGFDGDAIVVTGEASERSALDALRSGATDYLVKPVDIQRLRTMLRHVLRQYELRQQVGELQGALRSLGHFGELVGVSGAMQKVYDRLGRVAPTEAGVLITGETGTGKELAARTIHRFSRRRGGPFVAVNCGAIPESLMESELFGHERGAFSGADRQHRGYFERADGGTLFLDEITEMPAQLQVRLLRVLETGRLLRVGGERELEIDVRALAATNRDPDVAVAEGLLREDLRYRLDVFRVHMPPLRERGGDAGLLAAHFLAAMNGAEGTDKRLEDDARVALETYRWPGNVRELRNALYSAFVLADEVIAAADLPAELAPGAASSSAGRGLGVRVGMTVADAERRLIEATLDSVAGNRQAAAELLGFSLKTLYNRLRDYREADGGSPESESEEA